MKAFLALFLPAYGVTMVAVPVSSMLDHLGREATVMRALAALPIWVVGTALLALPFILAGAGLALLIQRVGGDRWQGAAGRLLFTLICAGLGAALMTFSIDSRALIAAASGGTAAWLAHSPAWAPRWRVALVVSMGLSAGVILGFQYD